MYNTAYPQNTAKTNENSNLLMDVTTRVFLNDVNVSEVDCSKIVKGN